jgi:predicted ATPase
MQQSLRYSHFEVRPAQRLLLVEGRPVDIGSRAFDVLLLLLQRQGQLVSKLDLLNGVWQGRAVEEANLTVQISTLRKLLGPASITTVSGRGYCLGSLGARPDGPAPQPTPIPSPASAVGVADDPGVPAARPASSNLPAQRSPLYGRAAELLALCTQLQVHRLVTLVGACGMGKSRLAQAAAQADLARWPDGAWMVDLASVSGPAGVVAAVARCLAIRLEGTGDPSTELLGHLGPRRLLLVLDNCEHVQAACCALAHAICSRTLGITLLVTSQQALRAPEERLFRVLPLALPGSAASPAAREFGALQLLSACIQASDATFRLTDENLPCATELCAQLDGMPLAIELAAARVPVLGLQGVLQRLHERFKLLKDVSGPTLGRHQGLLAALEWSHALLSCDEQRVFRRLAVFVGGFTLPMAQTVAADADCDGWAVIDALGALVDKSLVVALGNEAPRYGLLESMRAFALDRLVQSGEWEQIARRHAQAMDDLLAHGAVAVVDPSSTMAQPADRLRPEIRIALGVATDTAARTLAPSRAR